MDPEHASAVIDRLVADLARATGHPVEVIRLCYGLEQQDTPPRAPLAAA